MSRVGPDTVDVSGQSGHSPRVVPAAGASVAVVGASGFQGEGPDQSSAGIEDRDVVTVDDHGDGRAAVFEAELDRDVSDADLAVEADTGEAGSPRGGGAGGCRFGRGGWNGVWPCGHDLCGGAHP